MSFGTPVVPPESWNIAGSVGSILSLRSTSADFFGGRVISSASDRKPAGASPSTMPNFSDSASLRTRLTISVKSKSPCRSGVTQALASESFANWLTSRKRRVAIDEGDAFGVALEYRRELLGERQVPPVALFAVALRELGRERDDACQHAGQ